jgi:hypothetical protein
MRRADVFHHKAADLNGKSRVLEIESAPLETLKNASGEKQQKTVLYFVGEKKCLPLNLTNWDSVADICGDDTEDWPGHKVELFPATTQMGGKTVLHPHQKAARRQDAFAVFPAADQPRNG